MGLHLKPSPLTSTRWPLPVEQCETAYVRKVTGGLLPRQYDFPRNWKIKDNPKATYAFASILTLPPRRANKGMPPRDSSLQHHATYRRKNIYSRIF